MIIQSANADNLMVNQIVPKEKRGPKAVGRFGRPPLDQMYDTRKEIPVPRLAPDASKKKK